MTTFLPELRRLNYFHGQLLGEAEFRREQAYFVEKLKLRNRCLHGWGVACGLHVKPAETPTDPCYPEAGSPLVWLQPGVAVDCLGNEIVVIRPVTIDLWRELPATERQDFRDGSDLYLSIAYCQHPGGPTRAVYADRCGAGAGTEYGWWQDGFTVMVTGKPPETCGCADPCCQCCPDARVLLARIRDVRRDQQLGADAVQMNVRRPLSRYQLTTITGTSWVHGGTYSRAEAYKLLGREDPQGGLAIAFSGQVHTRSLVDGVIEVQVIEGGSGRNSSTWYIDGDLHTAGDDFTSWVRYRQRTDETLQRGDRVIITVRTPFILDRCCRPVDGTHVGGKVPLLPGYSGVPVMRDFCQKPPSGVGPWTSGTGTGAGNFQSWFFVEEKQ